MKNSSNNSIYATIGDVGYGLTLGSTALFAWSVLRFAADPTSTFLFDDQWKEEGFCVTNQNVPYWNSHDVCLYTDIICATIILGLYLTFSKTPGLERASKMMQANIIGVLLHGMAHGQVGAFYRNSGESIREVPLTLAERVAQRGYVTVASQETLGFAFWLALLFASMPESSKLVIVPLALVVQTGQILLPPLFGFTYVQTILMLASCLDQLNLKSTAKNSFWYSSNPWMVGLPLTLIGWMESTQCSSFVKDKLYGHVVYDAYIGVSLIVWYITCIVQSKNTASSEAKTKTP